jgi:hypothetical protein
MGRPLSHAVGLLLEDAAIQIRATKLEELQVISRRDSVSGGASASCSLMKLRPA